MAKNPIYIRSNRRVVVNVALGYVCTMTPTNCKISNFDPGDVNHAARVCAILEAQGYKREQAGERTFVGSPLIEAAS